MSDTLGSGPEVIGPRSACVQVGVRTVDRMIPLLRRLAGTRRDWRLDRIPRFSLPRPGLHWLGPIGIVVSVLVGWPAFSGATGEEGNVAFGLFIGAASIVLMAWSFVLPPMVIVLMLLPRLQGERPRQLSLDEVDRKDLF